MTLFDAGTLLFRIAVCVFIVESLGHWLLVAVAFRIGVKAASFELVAESLPGLAGPRRGGSPSVLYRVVSGGRLCVFRPRWVAWYQSPFRMHGVATWGAGRLLVVGRHAIGPILAVVGLLLVSGDAVGGFIRQGSPEFAGVVAVLTCGAGATLFRHLSHQATRFRQEAEELLADLGYPAGSGDAGESRGRRTKS
jgi:hypothetical protein